MIIALLVAALSQDGDRSGAGAAALAAAQTAENRLMEAPVVCDRMGNTLELNACGALDLEQEQDRMQRYLEAAEVRAYESDNPERDYGETSQSSAYLQASQAAWAAYADIRCRGVFDQWNGGTIRTIMNLGCKIEATRARTHDIWTDYLTYADSTPPVLPEPVRTVAEDLRSAPPPPAPRSTP